ncbi:MAG: zinc ribbon domain-containing protein [Burkholderiaceae bacterium]|jgi:uncharacterized OB-fold protein|nr:zinc ribbon domain-containing protein [Burkholderiaceae bacterium]
MNEQDLTPQPGKPTLFGVDSGQRPFLKGVRCKACGEVAFPPQHYGCEKCGSADLVDVALSPEGVVIGASQVHIHAQPHPKAPFTVAEVRLDAGPVVRALLDVGHESGGWSGRRVHGVVAASSQDRNVLEFRFGVTP